MCFVRDGFVQRVHDGYVPDGLQASASRVGEPQDGAGSARVASSAAQGALMNQHQIESLKDDRARSAG